MTEYLTEQEQIEVLKNWLKQYSLVILSGLLIAVLTMTGWRFWQQRQTQILTQASAVFDEMLTMRSQHDKAATITQAQKLMTDHPKTVYGQIAGLMLAREEVINKEYGKAENLLNWVMTHSRDSALKQIARVRLARVLLAENKPEESLKVLGKVNNKSFNGLIEEVKGDAYLAMKNTDKAREAYQQALTDLPNAEILRPLLQMKYDNLAPATNIKTPV